MAEPFKVGDRLALVDGDVVSIGTVAEVIGDQVRMVWDDGFDDIGTWSQNDPELRRVRR